MAQDQAKEEGSREFYRPTNYGSFRAGDILGFFEMNSRRL
jgi:hypothetical protein